MSQIVPPGSLVDRLIDFDLNRSFGLPNLFNNLKLIYNLRRLNFDLAINLRWNSDRSAIIAFLSGARIRVSSGPKNLMFLYNVKSAYPQGRYHEINRNIDITKDIGAKVNSFVPYIFISDMDTKYAREFYNKLNLGKNGLICVHPGASREIRAWRRERFTEVIRRLIEKFNVTVILTWGPQEKVLVETIAGELGPQCNRRSGNKNNRAISGNY